jgi:hypothetical protein
VATGDLFTTVMYPFIDVANGGSMNGYIDGLNAILDITGAEQRQRRRHDGHPGSRTAVGRAGRDRVPRHGHHRARPHQGVREAGDDARPGESQEADARFRRRYGTDTGFWTTSMFIETIYKEMVALNPPPAPASRGKGPTKNQKGSGE